MKLSLFKIEQEYITLADQIIDNGGELTEELETALQINKDQLESKGVCYGFIVKQLESDIDAINNEIERLEALKKSRSKTVDRLKEKLTQALNIYEITEIKTPTLKISFRKSESVEVDDVSLLDEQFKNTKTTVTADKTKIKEAIKNGEPVKGAVLKENKNIQIK